MLREPGIRNRGVVAVDASRMSGLLQGQRLSVRRLRLCEAGSDRACRRPQRQRRSHDRQRRFPRHELQRVATVRGLTAVPSRRGWRPPA